MKTRGFLVTMFAVSLSFAPQFVSNSSAAGTYSAQLISPMAGRGLAPGWTRKPNISIGLFRTCLQTQR
jgi:hypothetical protein